MLILKTLDRKIFTLIQSCLSVTLMIFYSCVADLLWLMWYCTMLSLCAPNRKGKLELHNAGFFFFFACFVVVCIAGF